jgi:hypothetical protein
MSKTPFATTFPPSATSWYISSPNDRKEFDEPCPTLIPGFSITNNNSFPNTSFQISLRFVIAAIDRKFMLIV